MELVDYELIEYPVPPFERCENTHLAYHKLAGPHRFRCSLAFTAAPVWFYREISRPSSHWFVALVIGLITVFFVYRYSETIPFVEFLSDFGT